MMLVKYLKSLGIDCTLTGEPAAFTDAVLLDADLLTISGTGDIVDYESGANAGKTSRNPCGP